MKRRFKPLVYALVMTLLISTCLTAAPQEVMAATAKVSSSEKANIKKLCSNFETFVGQMLADNDSDNKIAVGKSQKWVFQSWQKEDLTYKDNMVVPLGYMGGKKAAERVFGVKKFYVPHKKGDWGNAYPKLTVKSIKKESSSKYIATCDVKWVNSEDNTSKKWATVTVTMKKKKGTHYGFVAKSVNIKKLKNVF